MKRCGRAPNALIWFVIQRNVAGSGLLQQQNVRGHQREPRRPWAQRSALRRQGFYHSLRLLSTHAGAGLRAMASQLREGAAGSAPSAQPGTAPSAEPGSAPSAEPGSAGYSGSYA